MVARTSQPSPNNPHPSCLGRVTVLALLWLLSPWSGDSLSQHDSEARFEQLCRAFVDGSHPSARRNLLDFSQKAAHSRLATLGYYLVGHQDLQEGHLQPALDALEQALLGAGQVPIADFILFDRAEALQKLNQPAKANEAWQTYLRHGPRGPLARRAIHQLWQGALASGDSQLILRSQMEFPDLARSAEALYYAAAAQESQGEIGEAMNRYLRLLYRFPLNPASTKAQMALTRLQQDHPEVSMEVPLSWKRMRARKLFQGKRYREAIPALEALLEALPSTVDRSKLLLWRGISEFHSGKHYESIRTLEDLPPQFDQQPQAWFYRAENYRRLNDPASFEQTVRGLQQRYPNSSWLEKAWFSLGNSWLVKRQLEQANHFYQLILNHFSRGERVMNAHWRVAWYFYRKRDRRRALELFADHLRRFPSSPHRPSALYWTARSQEYFGEPQPAKLLYQAITEVFSNHYYARLSREHLNRLKPEPISDSSLDRPLAEIVAKLKRQAATRFSSDGDKLNSRTELLSDRVRALSLIQLFDLAAREFLQTRPRSRATELQAATLFHQGAHFPASTSYLQRVFPGYVYRPFESLPEEIWRMFFPIKYGPLFSKATRKHQLDPYLLAALVRQESAFDPNALSPAKAHGLMQLMPSTARRVARQLNLRRPSQTQLFDPQLNIRLGSKYLADRLRQFNGAVDQALASYNAGPHRVTLWLSEGNYQEPAEFVENIPFTETRNYVKIIHRNYWFYERLYGPAIWQ